MLAVKSPDATPPVRARRLSPRWEKFVPEILVAYRHQCTSLAEITRRYGISAPALERLVEEAGMATRAEVRAADSPPAEWSQQQIVADAHVEVAVRARELNRLLLAELMSSPPGT